MKDLKQYIGTKVISARPMNRQEYNDYRGWELPGDEDGTDDGYLVEYQDAGQSNHDDHTGYISWSPKAVFEGTYKRTEGMPFSYALEMAKNQGARIARKGWNGKGMFVFLVQGSKFIVNREPLLSLLGEGTEVNYHGHLDMKTADGMIVPWLCSQTDMLAEDWQIV